MDNKQNRSSFIESLQLCCKSGYLQFHGQFYNQIAGLAMGNPLAPDLSNIVLNDLLNTIAPQFPNDIFLIKKYVDDLLLIVNPDTIPDILSAFNSYNPRLSFTVEYEDNYSLPFLDLLIKRHPNNTLSTDWYTKPTYSGRLLNYYSQHPFHQKLNVAKNLIHRCFSLSDPYLHETNTRRIQRILLSNNFPSNTIKKLITDYKTRPSSSIPFSSSQNQPPIPLYRSLPYIPLLSDRIQKSLRSSIPNLRVAFKNYNKLANIYSNLKDPIPPQHRSNIVYRIPCSTTNCNSAYIGETKNQLKDRIKQHKYSITSKNSTASKLSEHALTSNHTFDFDNTSILATVPNHDKRLLTESVFIQLDYKPLNLKTDKQNLSLAYSQIINILKKSRS